MKRRCPSWLKVTVLCALALVLAAVVTYRCGTLPLSRASEVCRHFAHRPGVKASFVEGMQINDSVEVDVTLLQACDSLTYTRMLVELGKSEEFVGDVMKMSDDKEKSFTGLNPRGNMGRPPEANDVNNEVTTVYPGRYLVAVFHTKTEKQVDAVLEESLNKQIKIKTL